MFSDVGGARRPSCGWNGRCSGCLTLVWFTRPLAKSYIDILGRCFHDSSISAKSLGPSALMLNFKLYTTLQGHMMAAKPP